MIPLIPDLFPTVVLLASWVGFVLFTCLVFLALPKRWW